MKSPPWLTRVRLSRYRSIVSCDVELGPLAILVGANGSGKSNFLDALSLIADALSTSLEQALGRRGGLSRLLHQPAKPTAGGALPEAPSRSHLPLPKGASTSRASPASRS